MAEISLRSAKGSPLTIAEADANISNLNTELGTKVASSDYTPAEILTRIKTVTLFNSASGLNSDTLTFNSGARSAASTNIVNTIVGRDGSGNFAANVITATTLNATTLNGNVVGDLTGTVTGNASNVSGLVAIVNGGTGATTESAARTALGLGTISTQSASNVAITGGSITGITLGVANGGTGATDTPTARTNLGLAIGLNVQPFSNNLTALSAVSTLGFYVKDSGGTAVTRLIAGGVNINVANGDGISGNPTITFSTTPEISAIQKTGTNGVGDIGQSANRFAVIYGTSTSARYADLAEKYTTDREYETGTVITVSLDTTAEGTASFEYAQRVLGVVSAKPAFIMNDELDGQALALRGRVPVKVTGAIRKGQPLVANQDGHGIAGDHQNSFAIALETNLDPNVKLVECVIL
jgi:hypothetical protein